MYWDVSLGLKSVLMSRTDSLLNLSPLQKVASETNISVVNLIIGGFICLFKELIDDISVFVLSMKIVAKAPAILGPMAAPCVCK